jgi:hypothetical protein
MRFDGAQLAGHGEQCPRRNDIMNGEPELPRFPAQPNRFKQYFGARHRFGRAFSISFRSALA